MHNLSFDRSSLHAHYLAGGTPESVAEEAYRRLAAVDDPGIFIHLIEKSEFDAAARALPPFDPETYPLWGLPFAVKDNIDVAGCPTTAACPDFGYHPNEDAAVVALLKAAGAICMGKTNLDQFATGLVGVRSPYPVPRNAIDPAIVPGGSSSGSAVAVAHGIVTFSLGTDTAGSGRVPAALNNIVGLKPSLGALSSTGAVPACRTLDCISVFALSVPDAWAAFDVAAKFDATDPYSLDRPAIGFGPVPDTFRVGVPSVDSIEFFGDEIQARTFEDALEALEGQGATIVEIDFTPFYDTAKLLYEGAWVAERLTAIEDFYHQNPEALHRVTRQIIGGAETLSATQAFGGFYRLQSLRRQLAPVIGSVDMLCVPTIPTFYSVADLEADPITPNSNFGTYTNFVNLLDLCGMAVPMAPRSDGRPGSVTLLAPAGRDGTVASLAALLHGNAGLDMGATGHKAPAYSAPTPKAGPGEIEFVVVGAHMSGMALAWQMKERGARFLRSAQTATCYRMHALSGDPERPAMVRLSDDEQGASFACEVWAFPEHTLGGFLAGLPSPLSLGKVSLDDGNYYTGFLAEAALASAAPDISHFGGWRAYQASKA
ncbi:MAG: allophanate hydrolase [Proteobacteria bacterium]|nr:allophanate hydrolase [Pseudomonadota bacterium]